MSLFIRLIIAGAIIGAIIYTIGVEALVGILYNLNFTYVIYLLLLSVVLIWASCLKWKVFIKAFGHEVSILHLMRLYTISYFYNTFMPSYIGGDIARSYQLGRFIDSQSKAFVATFLERFTGLLAMVIIAAAFVLGGVSLPEGVKIAVLLIATGCLVLSLMFFSSFVGNWIFAYLEKIIALTNKVKLISLLKKLEEAMKFARGDKILFAKSMALSFLFHILAVLNTYVAGRAVGWEEPDIFGLCVVVPLILIVSMIPITPSGLGVQEGAFVFFLKRIGATAAEGFGVALILRIKVLIIAIVGGIMWAMQKK